MWPAPGDRHGPLMPMMVVLTVVTGVVDAASYLKLGHVFVANMTGNVVFLGFALAGARGLSAVSSLIALGSFLVGARRMAASRQPSAPPRASSVGGEFAQATLLAIALLHRTVGARTPAPPPATRYRPAGRGDGARTHPHSSAVPELTTTVLTRTLTGIASEAGLLGRPGDRPKLGAGWRRGRGDAARSAGRRTARARCVRRAALVPRRRAIVLAVGFAAHVLSRSCRLDRRLSELGALRVMARGRLAGSCGKWEFCVSLGSAHESAGDALC